MNAVFTKFVDGLNKSVAKNVSPPVRDQQQAANKNAMICSFLKECVFPYLLGGAADKLFLKRGKTFALTGQNRHVGGSELLSLRLRMTAISNAAIRNQYISVHVCKKTKRLIPVLQGAYEKRWSYNANLTWFWAGACATLSEDNRIGGRGFDTSVELYYLQLFMAAAYLSVLDPECQETKGLLLALRFLDGDFLTHQRRSVKELSKITALCCDPRAQKTIEQIIEEPQEGKIKYIEIDNFMSGGCADQLFVYTAVTRRKEKRVPCVTLWRHDLQVVTATM